MLRQPNESALTACIAVTPKPGQVSPARPAGHFDRIEDHGCAHMRGDSPADDHAGVDVDDEAHIRDPGPGGNECQIGDPQLIRACGGEITVDQVRMPRGSRITVSGSDFLGPSCPFDPCCSHKTGGLIAADIDTGPACSLPQLPHSIDAVVRFPQLKQLGNQLRVPDRTSRGATSLRGVVRAWSHLQYPADGLDSKTAPGHNIVPI